MNKQIILNKHLNGVEVGNSNESMLNAMTEFAKQYHKEQLILSGVVGQSEQLPLNKTFFNKARSLSYTEFSKWINTILR